MQNLRNDIQKVKKEISLDENLLKEVSHFEYEKIAAPGGFDWYSKRVIKANDWLNENYTLEDIRKRKIALREVHIPIFGKHSFF